MWNTVEVLLAYQVGENRRCLIVRGSLRASLGAYMRDVEAPV